MIKLGATEVDTIKIGTNGVDSIMLNGVQIYPTTGFAITQHPQSQTGEAGKPATDYPFSVNYTPPEATVQWEWCNDGEGGCTNFSPIDGATDDTYIPYPSSGDNIVLGQNYDHFRAVVSLDGEPDIESDAAILSVELGPEVPLSGDAADFLARPSSHTHTNSGETVTMESLHSGRVFPDGQRVYVGGYGMDDIQNAANAGFTVAGPDSGVASTNKLTTAANTICPDGSNMMYMPLIREVNGAGGGKPIAFDCFVDGTQASGTCMGDTATCSGYTTIGQTAVNDWATKTGMQRWMDVDDDNVYGWIYCLDDCRTKLRTSTTNNLYAAMSAYDPKKRVIGDFGLGDSYYPNSSATQGRMQEITCTISQNYFHGGNYAGDGDGYHKSRLMIGKWAENLKDVTDIVTPNNSKPRLIVQGWLWAFAWDAVVEHNSDQQYYEKEYMHDMLLSMMSGCNGLHFYQMSEAYINSDDRSICANEYGIRRSALYNSLKKIAVDEDVLKALVWGKRTGHQYSITASTLGPLQKYGNDSEFSDNALTIEDIQFKGKRYIICTNSQQPKEVTDWWDANPDGVVSGQNNPAVALSGCPTYRDTWGRTTPTYWHWYENEAPATYGVTTTLSGFKLPDGTGLTQMKVTEIVSGDLVTPNANGEIIVTLAPLESVVFVVEAADGWVNP